MPVQLLEHENSHYSIIRRGATGIICSNSSLAQCLKNDACCQYAEMVDDSHSNETKGNTFAPEQIACTESNMDVVQPQKVEVSFSTLTENTPLSEVHGKQMVAYSGSLSSSIKDCMHRFHGSPVSAVNVKSDISDHSTYDHLDHLSLKERQEILLSRKLLRLEKAAIEGNPGPLSKNQGDTSIVGGEASVNDHHSDAGKGSESLRKVLSERTPANSVELSSCGSQDIMPTSTETFSTSSTSVKMKDEPWEDSDFHNLYRNVRVNFPLNTLPVKSEPRVLNELTEDVVDHMWLQDRMKMLVSKEGSEVSTSWNYGSLGKNAPSSKYSPNASESTKPINLIRPRKRKKTATDSVETALEEDVPGLLQVLLEKGVLVNQIKLYGEKESNDALDESLCEDSFANLESVISKLFPQRQSFFKFASIRCPKGSRATYCLGCLISLVEQTRYLQFRSWPVEWGWCRDLQSFIFVFARHNRIVLERPEYGYATYFFEIVDSLPIDWQIKRLVTAMKLTNCSRVSLIENKAFSVGEDLSEGEAKVLMDYGWEPNTGLGTMLKYCDRVVHDRKNESDGSEWRSKIGNLLMDGYNGGSRITSSIPKNDPECSDAQSPEIKLEF